MNQTAEIIGDINFAVTGLEAALTRMNETLNATEGRLAKLANMSNDTAGDVPAMSNETTHDIGEAEFNNATIQGQLLLVPLVNASLNRTHERYLKLNGSLDTIRKNMKSGSKLTSLKKRVDSAMDVLKLLDPRFTGAWKRVAGLNGSTFNGNFTLTLRDEVDEVTQNMLEDANLAQAVHIADSPEG